MVSASGFRLACVLLVPMNPVDSSIVTVIRSRALHIIKRYNAGHTGVN